MLPYLTGWEQIVSLIGSVANVLPGLLVLLAVVTGRRSAFRALIISLGLFAAIYALLQAYYLNIPCFFGRPEGLS